MVRSCTHSQNTKQLAAALAAPPLPTKSKISALSHIVASVARPAAPHTKQNPSEQSREEKPVTPLPPAPLSPYRGKGGYPRAEYFLFSLVCATLKLRRWGLNHRSDAKQSWRRCPNRPTRGPRPRKFCGRRDLASPRVKIEGQRGLNQRGTQYKASNFFCVLYWGPRAYNKEAYY